MSGVLKWAAALALAGALFAWWWPADGAPGATCALGELARDDESVDHLAEAPASGDRQAVSSHHLEGEKAATHDTLPAESSTPASATRDRARALAWEAFGKQRDMGLRTVSEGWPVPLSAADLDSLYVIPQGIDVEALAVAVEAETISISERLLALGEEYQQVLQDAVEQRLREPPDDISQEAVPGGKKSPDEFLRVRSEADGWHFVYRLRMTEAPELARLLEQSKGIAAERRKQVDLVLERYVGRAVRRSGVDLGR